MNDIAFRPEVPQDSSFGHGNDLGRPRTRRRLRRPVLTSMAAAGLVVSMGGAAVADPGFARLLRAPLGVTTTASGTNVAGSVSDALVDIVTTNRYDGSQAAGTGMILTTNGEILTNNHVVEGATSLAVTVVATGKTYTASVVGTDPTDDVAVIQLASASGLETLPIGDASRVQIGDRVVASGNAGGTGGAPSVVTGTVTDLNQTITASDESGANAETLNGLIETNAPIEAGDSGGALATADGEVIGMNTAASVSNSMNLLQGSGQTSASEAYAIPIQNALAIAEKITNGEDSSTIHIGTTGFLGVQLASTSGALRSSGGGMGFATPWGDVYGELPGQSDGATSVSGVQVAGVVSGGAADEAGLAAGDVITSVNGTSIAVASALSDVLAKTAGGQKVAIEWTDASGQSHSGTVTLDDAPAD